MTNYRVIVIEQQGSIWELVIYRPANLDSVTEEYGGDDSYTIYVCKCKQNRSYKSKLLIVTIV